MRSNTQTAVTNIRYKRILEIIFYLTFRMLLHSSSKVTVNVKIGVQKHTKLQVKDNFKYAFVSDVCHRCLCVISDKT